MITDIFLYIISFILGMLASLLQFFTSGWSVWPPQFLIGLNYFFTKLMDFNAFFPIDSLLSAISFLIKFVALYFTARLLVKLFSLGRGTNVDI